MRALIREIVYRVTYRHRLNRRLRALARGEL
jgi:hypothetical protein